jgi:Protein of unknown function (DUF3489)
MTTDLSPSQRTILAAAAEREGGAVLPVTGLKGGAIRIVLQSLVRRGLIEEATPGEAKSLRITTAGHAVLGLHGHAAAGESRGPDEPAPERRAKAQARAKEPGLERAVHSPRENTKQAMLIGMLRRSEGATIAEIMAATGWQAHTVRGAIAGALKRRLGLEVTSDKVEGRGRVYRIAP